MTRYVVIVTYKLIGVRFYRFWDHANAIAAVDRSLADGRRACIVLEYSQD